MSERGERVYVPYADAGHNARRRSRVPAIIFGGLAAITASAAAWFGLETYLLAKNKQPETWYIRNYTSWHPKALALGLVAIGFAVGAGATHFVWDEDE